MHSKQRRKHARQETAVKSKEDAVERRSKQHSRLGVVVVWVHVDVPQAQLMQLANDLLHGVLVLVGHPIQGAGTGRGSRFLGVGEVHQPSVACAGNDLVPMLGGQERVPASHWNDCEMRQGKPVLQQVQNTFTQSFD